MHPKIKFIKKYDQMMIYWLFVLLLFFYDRVFEKTIIISHNDLVCKLINIYLVFGLFKRKIFVKLILEINYIFIILYNSWNKKKKNIYG